MEARGRGRSRGRASRGAQAPPGQGYPQRPGPPQGGAAPSQHSAPGPQGAWGARPPLQQPAPPSGPSAWVRPAVPAPATQAVGRGARQGGGDDASQPISGLVQGMGEIGLQENQGRRPTVAGSGGVRGRTTNRNEVIFTRPQGLQSKKGTTGQPINLTSNYFQLLQAGKWCLNQYRVDFAPEIDATNIRKSLFRNGIRDRLNGYLFDGTCMYTPQALNPDPLEVFVANEAGENVRITVRHVGDVAWGDYHYIQLFNIIIRKCLVYLKLQLIGRNYFDPETRISVPEHRLELWPGYYTSMRQHEKHILLNADVQFKVLRMDTVLDLMNECRGQNMRQEFTSKIIGSVVLTYYNNRTYKIDDVDFQTTPASTFPMKDGRQCSYVQYYKDKYNINIRNDRQPMLISRSKQREIRAGMAETIYLVPELCQMTGLTDKQRDNFQLMRALAEHTRVGPRQRMAKLMEFSNRLRNNRDVVEELRRWDLSLANSLVQFQGRVLPNEQIVGGNGQKYPAGEFADWTRNLRSLPLFAPGRMQLLVVITPGKLYRDTQNFVQNLQRAANGMSWDIGNPKVIEIPDDRTQTYLDAIQKIKTSDNPSLIMTVLPSAGADRYSAIKKKCCVDLPVPSQVILAKNFRNKDPMSIATKVCIQLNCKVGGAPWTINMPLNHLMVIGYDVCRDTANKRKSFGAMVASLDKQITRYFSFTSEHSMEEELSNNFAAFTVLACEKYKEHNGRYPERILIFRDGVGDGQLPYVYDHELTAIKKKLSESIYTNNDLKMAFVIVSKRINSRFVQGDRNPPPGTVVDDVVTLPERYDYFIVSQCVRQGTVAPTSYNVIEDSMGLPADRLQILTYKLTHMYYNLSGTVRVPAPCQYAHKLAFLVAQSLHRPAHRVLENLLYFL